jgi:hypothetical protein
MSPNQGLANFVNSYGLLRDMAMLTFWFWALASWAMRKHISDDLSCLVFVTADQEKEYTYYLNKSSKQPTRW